MQCVVTQDGGGRLQGPGGAAAGAELVRVGQEDSRQHSQTAQRLLAQMQQRNIRAGDQAGATGLGGGLGDGGVAGGGEQYGAGAERVLHLRQRRSDGRSGRLPGALPRLVLLLHRYKYSQNCQCSI